MGTRLAVITGASSGLGEVFARKLAKRGWNLRLLARRVDRLQILAGELGQLHGISVAVEQADLADAAVVERVADSLAAEPSLELLVNNAGFGTKGYFWQVPVERQRAMHQLHVMTVMRLCHAALQGMVARDRGGIINVASVAAYVRSVGGANYCATKGWMNDITEGIWLDLQSASSRVKVQALCPGFTYTEFHDTLGASRDPVPKSLWLSADFVVEESLRGLDDGQLFVIPSWKYRMAASVLEIVPVSWRLRLSQKSPHTKTRMVEPQ